MEGGSRVRWMSPLPGMDEVGGKGDGIAKGPALSRCHQQQGRMYSVSVEQKRAICRMSLIGKYVPTIWLYHFFQWSFRRVLSEVQGGQFIVCLRMTGSCLYVLFAYLLIAYKSHAAPMLIPFEGEKPLKASSY